MSKAISGRFAAGFVLAAATAATATALDARQDRDALRLDCELTIEAEALPVQEQPFDVRARFTQAVGDTLSVHFAEESKVVVLGVTREGEEEPNAVRVTVNTESAAPGTWGVILTGEAGECAGTATVAVPEPSLRR
jgi:hypothetical protein